MPGLAVVTDSTSCLDPVRAANAGVTVVPLQVVVDGRSRAETEVSAREVADALRAGRPVTTSRPSPEVFAAAYAARAAAGSPGIVSVHLSAEVSGTCEAARTAAASAAVPVVVVDSRTLAMGLGFAALAGARAARLGRDAAAVADAVTVHAAASVTYFCVGSLEPLHRSGRIGGGAALLGSALAVKPLLTVRDGRIAPHERVRTTSRALHRLAQLGVAAVERAATLGEEVDVAVLHLDHEAAAQRVADQIRDGGPAAEVVVAELGAVLGGHVGNGTVAVVVAPRLPVA